MIRTIATGVLATVWLGTGLDAGPGFGTGLAQAQGYPNKTVSMITSAAAGNAPDVVGRLVADRLSKIWKQPVVVLNRPGGGGVIALQGSAEADKDGHTLYLLGSSTYTILPISQQGRMPVDLHSTFTPIGLVVEQPIAIGVNKDVPAKTLPELLTLMKQTPDGMMFAGSFRGSTSHLSGELFRERTHADMTFVHAAGAAASVNDVIAGRIPIMIDGLATQNPGVQGGGIRLLAIGSAKRLPNVPDLPTVSETVPGLSMAGWTMLAAPAGTPDAIVRKISADLRSVLQSDDLITRLHELGGYPQDLSPEDTKAYIAKDEQLWWPVARQVLNDSR